MNSVAIEFLSQLEEQQRARQIKALQLLNQARAERPQPSPLRKRLGNGLAQLLARAGQRLQAWSVSPDRPLPGEA